VIAGVHAILFAPDPEAARAFLREVLALDSVDSGGGWLIFALPPAELACHPTETTDGHCELYLMCKDIEAARAALEERGVEFVQPITDQGWGLLTRFKLPGYGEIGLYEPRHPSPLQEFS
jgi:predicted enzyme related to lactoylglutathione lyase